MNTAMWRHPVTRKQIKILEEEWNEESDGGSGWVTVLRPTEKELACGDTGTGAMMEWKEIVEVTEHHLELSKSTTG